MQAATKQEQVNTLVIALEVADRWVVKLEVKVSKQAARADRLATIQVLT